MLIFIGSDLIWHRSIAVARVTGFDGGAKPTVKTQLKGNPHLTEQLKDHSPQSQFVKSCRRLWHRLGSLSGDGAVE